MRFLVAITTVLGAVSLDARCCRPKGDSDGGSIYR